MALWWEVRSSNGPDGRRTPLGRCWDLLHALEAQRRNDHTTRTLGLSFALDGGGRHSHRHQEFPTGCRTKTSDATSRVGQRSCRHFGTGCGFEHRCRIPFRSHHQLSKCGENQKIEQLVISQPMAAGSILGPGLSLTGTDNEQNREQKADNGTQRVEPLSGTRNPCLQWARIEGSDQPKESSHQSRRA